MTRHVVATVEEVTPGARKRVTVKGRDIVLFNLGGEFFALIDRCPHEGAPLGRGHLCGLARSSEPGQYSLERKGEMLRCPWHGWEFDIRTGQSWCDPKNTFVKQYAVTVEPGETVAKGPFRAETVPVSVEQDYVVIEV
jgi:3-phenylpropionate/trans-cinnamate dioxygenase ferredoxin subunit